MNLVQIPALIDPHVHFRVPGLEYKESWETAALAAFAGGFATVFDMPNTKPPTNTLPLVRDKKSLIDAQLKNIGIPLRYGLYLGADSHCFEEIARCRHEVVGLKIFMGSSTGGLVMEKLEDLHTAFRVASENDMLVAVHAEDEALIRERSTLFTKRTDPLTHSLLRNEDVAARAVRLAISLAKLYGTRLYILHVSTEEELDLIARAKDEGLPIFAETTPHHLWLSTDDYQTLSTQALVNPPLRDVHHKKPLWAAVRSGLIDTIGSDHAPHTLLEKMAPYGQAPAGFPGIETTLPLLTTVLSLDKIVELMHTNPQKIFRFKAPDATITIDLDQERVVDPHTLHSKAKWSPFAGWTLKGWPVTMTFEGTVYDLTSLGSRNTSSV